MASRTVNFSYPPEDLQKLYRYAQEHDVESEEKPGRYDCGCAAIKVWTNNWLTNESADRSHLMGIFFIFWSDDNRIWKVESEDSFTIEDMLNELAILEEATLGKTVHGCFKAVATH